jgi:subtilisin family serine protease
MPVRAQSTLRLAAFLAGSLAIAGVLAPTALSASPRPEERAIVGFRSEAALAEALRCNRAQIVRRLPALNAVEVVPTVAAEDFAAAVSDLPGIEFAGRTEWRTPLVEPALAAVFRPGLPYEWQYVATRENEVPEAVLRAASAVKVAVVDTGADVTQPDLAAKAPETWDVVRRRTGVRDSYGHGTFVSALAAGAVSNGEGIAGFAGDARLLVVKAAGRNGIFSDVDEAAAILYAVDHGAKVVNLSLGGTGTSAVEQRAVQYAAAHDVLLVAAAGNEFEDGNPVEYPAALLQPPGSKGQGGVGLSVGASTMSGKRASFSNTGSHLSLAAPGDSVFGDLAAGSSRELWPRYDLPGSAAGLYGWSSGTSFSAPQVTGAAALVWAANPLLTARQVAGILKTTASGRGRWTPRLGYGVIDIAAAVAAAAGQPVEERVQAGSSLRLQLLRLRAHGLSSRRPREQRVTLSARLRTSAPTISPAFRVVTLEVRRGGHWSRVARNATRAAGQVRWTVRLRSGRHRLRVSYGGRWDLRSATRVLHVSV